MEKNKLKSRLENLPEQVSAYINAVIKKMRYRKKVRNDVKAELIDHFEDELKDCKKEEEREVKAKELIESFGNVKLLGVLLRRAKKRCRPLWRTVTVRFFQAIGVIIILFVLYLAWFMTGKPVITTDYFAELDRMIQPTADESENAEPYYSKAVELLREKHKQLQELTRKDFDELTPAEKQMWAEWLEGEKEGFNLIKQGTAKKYYWVICDEGYDPNSGLMSLLMPSMRGYRDIAMDLIMRAKLSAENGEFGDSVDDLVTCHRLGRHLKGHFTLIGQLVGVALEAISYGAIKDIISIYEIDSDSLEKLKTELEAGMSVENFAFNFEMERLTVYDTVQRVFIKDIFGGTHIGLGISLSRPPITIDTNIDSNPVKSFFHILFTHPDKKETIIMADKLYDFLDEVFLKSPAQLRTEGINIDSEAMKIIKGNMLLEIFCPSFGMLYELNWRRRTDLSATITIIALLQYEQENGEFPESLDKLKEAGFINEITIDPWVDEPLIYRKTEGNFILYCVGGNLVDDGGMMGRTSRGTLELWQANGDNVFWPMQEEN